MPDKQYTNPSDSLTGAVRDSYLFKTLSDRERSLLLQTGEEVTIAEGDIILSQGEEGDCFFLVLDGKVRVSTNRGTDVVPLAELGRGALLGEVAVLNRGKRTATAVALTETRLVKFPRDSFLSLLDGNPKLKALIKKVVARRAEDTIEKTLKTMT
ncbi:MAG: cyclic nucleotide-binding domain-containing protein [Deltaproteobacteria bacterium]|nr:cyclic nucleotide-binding domain-containing protein [Deltaproteobacteria bacterium]